MNQMLDDVRRDALRVARTLSILRDASGMAALRRLAAIAEIGVRAAERNEDILAQLRALRDAMRASVGDADGGFSVDEEIDR